MKFVDLSKYLHQNRQKRTGRRIGYRMTAMEIWTESLDCQLNGVGKIFVREEEFTTGCMGFFSRLSPISGDGPDIVEILVDRNLEPHIKEFVVAKELMHYWSPDHSYVRSPAQARTLVQALFGKTRQLSALAIADQSAVIAAAEVMLPHYILERDIAGELSVEEIASRHDLHPDVAQLLCAIEHLTLRKNGSL